MCYNLTNQSKRYWRSKANDEMVICPQCGKQMSEAQRFCTGCGYRRPEESAPTPQPEFSFPIRHEREESRKTTHPTAAWQDQGAPAPPEAKETPSAGGNDFFRTTYEEPSQPLWKTVVIIAVAGLLILSPVFIYSWMKRAHNRNAHKPAAEEKHSRPPTEPVNNQWKTQEERDAAAIVEQYLAAEKSGTMDTVYSLLSPHYQQVLASQFYISTPELYRQLYTHEGTKVTSATINAMDFEPDSALVFATKNYRIGSEDSVRHTHFFLVKMNAGWRINNILDNTADFGYLLKSDPNTVLEPQSIEGFSKQELRYAKNEIMARHGKIFTDESLDKYFSQKDWYKPRTDYSDTELSATERQNMEVLAASEEGDFALAPQDQDVYKVQFKDMTGDGKVERLVFLGNFDKSATWEIWTTGASGYEKAFSFTENPSDPSFPRGDAMKTLNPFNYDTFTAGPNSLFTVEYPQLVGTPDVDKAEKESRPVLQIPTKGAFLGVVGIGNRFVEIHPY